jgi:ligand-binding sensor domain-containing protein
VGCERGVEKIETGTYRSRLFDQGRGLPSDQVLSLAPAPDGVWVGTTRGLAVITADDKVVPLGGIAQPVLSLLAVGDTLWVGTAGGLGRVEPGSNVVAVPAEVAAQPALSAPIVALARLPAGDTVIVATADQLAWRDGAGKWTLLRARVDLGDVTAATGDVGGAWLGGTLGLAFWDVGHGTFQALRVPGDVPATVRDVAVDDAYVWVATDSGLVRLTRAAARGQ